MSSLLTRREIIKKGGLALTALVSPFQELAFSEIDHMKNSENFEVIIVGGSYSGLSAAMALGRAMRNVLIIDSGLPCNRQTPHSHNFITQDGEKPNVIAENATAQVLKYDTVKRYHDLAISGEKSEKGFTIETQSGKKFTAKKVIFATGIRDVMPDIKGFSECWGISVIHCPYCHGYEVRNEKTGILANGDMALHYARLVHNLTTELTIFTNGKSALTQTQTDRISGNHIQIVEKEIAYLKHKSGHIRQIVFKDQSTVDLNAIYARPDFEQHCKIPSMLGCDLTDLGYIKVDSFQKTTVPDIFACGDNASPMRSIAGAVAAGNMAGAAVNNELTDTEF